MAIKSGLSRHTVLSIPRRLIQLCFVILPVKISYTICYLIYCVKAGYFWPLKIVLSRHNLLAITQILIQFFLKPVKRVDTMC